MLTIWLKPQLTKSANCISTTGRQPSSAAPAATPSAPLSAIGVSSTRSGHRCQRPRVTRNAPSNRPMSWPRRITAGSLSISSTSAWWMASTYVTRRAASSDGGGAGSGGGSSGAGASTGRQAVSRRGSAAASAASSAPATSSAIRASIPARRSASSSPAASSCRA